MSLADDMRALVADLAEHYGKPVTLQRVEEEFDPETGTPVEVITPVDATATPPKGFSFDLIDGTLVLTSDVQIDVPAEGLDMGEPAYPTIADRVEMDGETWRIEAVGRLYGGAEVAAYRLQLRR